MTYAYWRKCDFQIHTPRDPNWRGQNLPGIGEEIGTTGQLADVVHVKQARNQWAEKFVEACVVRKLQAVALTDHHEMVMVPYVQDAIENRAAEDPSFDLWLFPGMELTCRGGQQCILLFDADLAKEWWKQAQSQLGIAHPEIDPWSSKASKVTQLSCNYADIDTELDKVEALKDRYIVLPNVSQGGGKHTVLTDGNHADFLRMKYVGGYLDNGQTIETLSKRNLSRLSGNNPTWSNRKIYPLPTSDCRTDSYTDLGENSTWIKLATPSAEAIRQAFLGHRSRICLGRPKTPSLVVKSVTVRGATVLDNTDIALSPELNAVIGGRGSGKSSFLEYLAFGLGRSCHDLNREKYTGSDRLSELIRDTLIAEKGTVTVCVLQDGASFKVERGPNTGYEPEITYPTGESQTVRVKELRDQFPATVYSQGELSELGSRSKLPDLLQFVNVEYKREDDKLTAEIGRLRENTRTTTQKLTNYWKRRAELRKQQLARASLAERITALERSLPKLSPEDEDRINNFKRLSGFETKRLQATKHVDRIVNELSAIRRDLASPRDLSSPPNDEAKAVQQQYNALFKEFSDGIRELQERVDQSHTSLTEVTTAWSAEYSAARDARDGALEKHTEHKAVADQIVKLREQLSETNDKIGDLEVALDAAGDPLSVLESEIEALKELVAERSRQTQAWAEEIEKLSSNKIKANVVEAGDLSQLKSALDFVASKTGSQETRRVERIEEVQDSQDIWTWLDALRSECISLLHWREVGAAEGQDKPACPELLAVVGETEKIQTALVKNMDTARLEALATALPLPEINLFYRDGDREMIFEKASEGQRAGALLFMLLDQQGGPLIVDQPEGDLDNKIVTELTEKLHGAKKNRQLIFASHNANLVVNGSSELVGHLEVTDEGRRAFEASGAIDNPAICKLIAETMEGGEKAFIDRKAKYGF